MAEKSIYTEIPCSLPIDFLIEEETRKEEEERRYKHENDYLPLDGVLRWPSGYKDGI